jgi:hypothetical protein
LARLRQLASITGAPNRRSVFANGRSRPGQWSLCSADGFPGRDQKLYRFGFEVKTHLGPWKLRVTINFRINDSETAVKPYR